MLSQIKVNSAKDSNLVHFNAMLQHLNIKCDLTIRETYNQLQALISKQREENPKNPTPIVVEMITELYINSSEGGKHIDSIIDYSYFPESERDLFLDFRNTLAGSLIKVLKIKCDDVNDTMIGESLIFLTGKVMCDVLYQMLEEFLPFPEDADNSALLNYYLKVIKSIQTEYSLSYQVLIDNGIPTEFALPLSSFEHHELLLSQLQNIIKFYKQIESNSLNILELYTLIIQRLKEISEIKNDVYKCKLELLFITRYIELLSLYENIETEGKSSENKFEDKIVQTELYQALKIERAFEEKIKNNGKTEELIEKDNTINEQDPNTLRMNSKVQTQITELQSEIKEIQSDNKQKTEQIKHLNEQIQNQNEQIQNLNEQIQNLNEQIQNQNAQIQNQNEQIQNQNEKINSLVNDNRNNQRLISQLIQKLNKTIEELKNETKSRREQENNNKILKNKNKMMLKVIKDLNTQVDRMKVDLILISKRGYLKILIKLCNAIQSNPAIRTNFPTLSNEKNIKLLLDIKNVFNYITHNPKVLIGDTINEKTIKKMFDDIKKYFLFDDRINKIELDHIYNEIQTLPQYDSLLLIDEHNKQKNTIISQYLEEYRKNSITLDTIPNLLKSNPNQSYPIH